MSGSFRDSFTKEDTKEDILGYDDTAFYYFVISVLTCVAIPWTCSVVYHVVYLGHSEVEKGFPKRRSSGSAYRYCATSDMVTKVDEARKAARRCTPRSTLFWCMKATLLVILWAGIFGTVNQLGNEKEIKKFDPFDILDVPPEATNPQIKRAYRKLSLIYHPDKNPDDPLAASRFIQITKAYQALTDEIAKRNWEKYGNPDGPQTTKVGIGLPRFLLEKDNHIMILVSFFFVLLFVVPVTFICYYQQIKNYTANGVMIETLQFLGYYISESTRVKNCPEMLASCAESRSMATRPTDNLHMKQLAGQVVEHKKRQFTLPIVMKNQYLIWSHMQRRHHLMSMELRSDCDELLRHSMKITQAMIELACMREWFATAQAMIEFRRCLVQALDVKSSQLLQIPHFQDEHLEKCRAAAISVVTLEEFLRMDTDERKKLLDAMQLKSSEILDIDAFCAHVGDVELKASIGVEDEQEIVVGDVATVTVQMKRKNLQEEEAVGPSHAPLFPDPKNEEWWLFLVEATERPQQNTPVSATRIIHFERILDTERFVEEKLRFQVTNAGKTNLVLHALCDAYAGIDKKVDLSFRACTEEELKRPLPAHKDDEDLDLQPTLFQQWMGLLNEQDESEEEEGEEGEETPGSPQAASNEAGSPARTAGSSPDKGAQAPDDEGEDESDASSSDSD